MLLTNVIYKKETSMQCYKPTMNTRDTANVIDKLLHKITEIAQILKFFPRLRGSLSSIAE